MYMSLVSRGATRWLAFPVAVLLALTPAGAARAVPLDAPSPVATDLTVTLVTGDRVTLRTTGDGPPAVAIEPARWPGRVVDFRTMIVGGNLRVMPSDVAHLVPSVLDPALFDVSALARSGLHDAATGSLPLIVQGAAGRSGTAGWAVSTLLAERQLPSIGAVAVTLPKPGAEAMGMVLASGPPGRVWLDATVRAATTPAVTVPAVSAPAADKPSPLDRNLVQIGAPAAWDAGLSGAGVRVAVLDTGVDAAHPDLAGRVAAEANFTGSPDVSDHNGHGTHVASIVAGTGEASGGARRGVAFGATLLSGKVLDDRGVGSFSSIIAGMEWAAAEGAGVVNMSLSSGFASTGRDPLSLAVDSLTASHGVLFVASAGNTGPGPTTIGAPGAADAALTVGAVDGHDRLADFSSRGPRLGDLAIKPDLVAPGVDIVAARAAGTSLGDPVGSAYTRLTGTSMAAPQVAGAAALLAERHPEWTPARLKAALLGTAVPAPHSGAFDAGAGRLDLTTGIRQPAFADPATVGFGLISYPQAGLPPVERTVTLTNDAGTALTVDLSASLRDPAGHKAPEGMVAVAPARLTVPAQGSATVTVTLDPALGATGAFAGEVLATPTQAGEVLRVPVGVVKESTRHTVTIHGLDRNGTSQIETLVSLINLNDVVATPDPVLMSDGVASVRVQPGVYAVTAALPTLEEGGEPVPDGGPGTGALVVTSVSIATLAEVDVNRDMELTLDARAAQPISAAVSGVDTFPTDVRLFLATGDRADNRFVLGYDTSAQDVVEGRLFVQPTGAVRHGTLEVGSKWRLHSTLDAGTYDLLLAGARFPEPLRLEVDPGELTRVETTYRATGAPTGYREARFVFTDLNPVSVAVAETVPAAAPLTRTEFLTGTRGQRWFQCVTLAVSGEGVGNFCQLQAEYRAGTTVERSWLRAPLRTTAAAFRGGTTLQVAMSDMAESGHISGSIASHALVNRSYTLHRDGVLIAEGSDPIGVHAVPPGPATFRLTRTVEMRPDLMPLSTGVDTVWTFPSEPPREGRPAAEMPLPNLAVGLPVDGMNRVAAGVPLDVTVAVAGAARVRMELSIDEGHTWSPVTLKRHGHDSFQATVPAGTLPAGALVWLRAEAADRDGGHVIQTVRDAFGVAPDTPDPPPGEPLVRLAAASPPHAPAGQPALY
jgi:subtilisin family serine protease